MNFSTIQNFFFFASLGFISMLFIYLLSGFAFPIFFAIVLAIIFYPFYKKVLKIFKNKKNLAATFSVFFVLILIIVPIFLTSSLVLEESTEIYKTLSPENISSQKEIFFNKYEVKIKDILQDFNLDYDETKEKVVDTLKKIMEYLTTKSLSFGKDTISVLVSFLLTIYIMFYFFRDGEKFLKKISNILPLGNDNEKKIFKKFALIIKSIFKGSLIVALIQGGIGGVLFYFVGIKAVFLWTILMIILSIIPALGPTVILIPTAGILFLIGDSFNAYILLAGSVVISVSDNVLRPIFIGNSIKMHDLILTLSILGGIGVFGILGFIIGPVIAGLFILSWELFEEKYKKQLKEDG